MKYRTCTILSLFTYFTLIHLLILCGWMIPPKNSCEERVNLQVKAFSILVFSCNEVHHLKLFWRLRRGLFYLFIVFYSHFCNILVPSKPISIWSTSEIANMKENVLFALCLTLCLFLICVCFNIGAVAKCLRKSRSWNNLPLLWLQLSVLKIVYLISSSVSYFVSYDTICKMTHQKAIP